jgi:eukaryotic translation initiation factor 2C
MGDLGHIQTMARASRDVIPKVVRSTLSPASRAEIVAAGSWLPVRSDLRLEDSFPVVKDALIKTNRFPIPSDGMPERIYGYDLKVFRFDRLSKRYSSQDSCRDENDDVLVAIVLNIRKNHREWGPIPGAYDGRARMFTTASLELPGRNGLGKPFLEQDVFVGSKRFKVVLTEVQVISCVTGEQATGTVASSSATSEMAGTLDCGTALSTALLSFIRYGAVAGNAPAWFAVGSKAFSASVPSHDLGRGYEARKGFHVSIKQSICGFNLELDMSISCFLVGGPIINVIAAALRLRSPTELLDRWSRGPGERDVEAVNAVIKNCKVRLSHLGHTKKCKALGPVANDKKSEFSPDEGGKRITVAQYYANMVKANKQNYKPLQYPSLPTVNVGSTTRPILIPIELVAVFPGQCKPGRVTPEMTAEMIKLSTTGGPSARFEFIEGPDSFSHTIRSDEINQSFGLANVKKEPLSVPFKILPAPALQYRPGIVNPELRGAWIPGSNKCVQSPVAGDFPYGVLLVGNASPGAGWEAVVSEFCRSLETEARSAGWTLKLATAPTNCINQVKRISEALDGLRAMKCRSVVAIMLDSDSYNNIKMASDPLGIITSCAQWRKVKKAVEGTMRGYQMNFVTKMTTKLGGVTHTLASNLPSVPPSAASGNSPSPPSSLSWLCDRPCMFVGIDVSHPEIGSMADSVAAVVGSVDRNFKDYAAHISLQKASRTEMVSQLEDAMVSLLGTFHQKNGAMPATIVIFRDGVSDGQFDIVLEKELPFVKSAIELMGSSADTVKIVIVVCQKGHHTRLVFEDGDKNILNPCPGLCVDGSICSAKWNEFFLNSSVAIQGTSKPCKYALIYDEVGLKVSLIIATAAELAAD